MTVAFDAHSSTGVITTSPSFTHSPVGTPKGVIVGCIQDVNQSAQIDVGPTYGGTTVPAVALSPLLHATGLEDARIEIFFLGENIPTGNQTVAATVNGTGSNKIFFCITLTAATAKTTIEDTSVLDSDVVVDPSVNVTLAAAVNAWIGGVLHSGHDLITGHAPAAGFTELGLTDPDFGVATVSLVRRDSNGVGAGDFAVGWTAASEEAGIFAFAVKEVPDPPAGGVFWVL